MILCLKHLYILTLALLFWIHLFYNNTESYIVNNGYMSTFFPIQRWVRQGCPHSPYLFIICIELFSFEVKTNKDIKGINIGNLEVNNSLFADDASFFYRRNKKIVFIVIKYHVYFIIILHRFHLYNNMWSN